jgi:RsiW-degrading membrane proteinase PrsW (M82 family)
MLSQPESFIALLIYFVFFGLIGARRGWKKEALVFVVGFASYLALLQTQGRLAFLINTGGNYALAGFPSDQEGLLTVFAAPPIISGDNRATFIFLLWALLLVGLYFLGDRIFAKDAGKSKSLGFLTGIANGVLYLSLIATRLFPIFTSDANLAEAPPGTQLQQVVNRLQDFVEIQLSAIFTSISRSDQRTLLMITLFVIIAIAAYSLYGGRKSQAQKK